MKKNERYSKGGVYPIGDYQDNYEALELEIEKAKYHYARVFLEYLDVAKKLLELQALQPDVDPARELIRTGRNIYQDYKKVSISMERALYPRCKCRKPGT